MLKFVFLDVHLEIEEGEGYDSVSQEFHPV